MGTCSWRRRVQPRHRIVEYRAGHEHGHVHAPRSTKTSDRGIPRRSRHGSCSMAPPRSTKTSDRGIPRRSRTWVHVQWRRRVQPRHRIVEYRAGHEHEEHVHGAAAFNQDIGSWNTAQVTDMGACSWRHRVQPRHRIVEYRAGHDMGTCSVAPPRSTKTSDRGIPRRSRHGYMFMAPPRSTKTSDRGIPRRSRPCRPCSMTPRRSTKTSDRGIPRRSRHAGHVQRARVQPRYRIVEYRAGHDMGRRYAAAFNMITAGPHRHWRHLRASPSATPAYTARGHRRVRIAC